MMYKLKFKFILRLDREDTYFSAIFIARFRGTAKSQFCYIRGDSAAKKRYSAVIRRSKMHILRWIRNRSVRILRLVKNSGLLYDIQINTYTMCSSGSWLLLYDFLTPVMSIRAAESLRLPPLAYINFRNKVALIVPCLAEGFGRLGD